MNKTSWARYLSQAIGRLPDRRGALLLGLGSATLWPAVAAWDEVDGGKLRPTLEQLLAELADLLFSARPVPPRMREIVSLRPGVEKLSRANGLANLAADCGVVVAGSAWGYASGGLLPVAQQGVAPMFAPIEQAIRADLWGDASGTFGTQEMEHVWSHEWMLVEQERVQAIDKFLSVPQAVGWAELRGRWVEGHVPLWRPRPGPRGR